MRRPLAAACALGLAACGTLAQKPEAGPASPQAAPPAPAAPGSPLAPLGWLAELSGACWRGDYPDKASSDTQCYLAQYQSLLRGTIKAEQVQAGIPRTIFEGDAVFAYEPRKGRIVFTQWGWNNTYATGEVLVEAERLTFVNFLPDGTPAKVRSVWTRTAPDGFRVVRERQGEDGAWKDFLAVDYKRVR